jgi:hypothetical protein
LKGISICAILKAAAMVQPIKEEVFKNVDVVASDDGEVVLVKDCTTCTAWRCRDLDLEQCAQWKPDITQPSKLMGILCCDPVVAVVAVAVTVLEQEVVCIQQDGQQWVPVFSPALRPYDGVLNFKTATNRVCVRTLYGCAVYATPASRTHFHVQYTFDLQGFFPRMLWFPCSDQIVVLFSAEEDHAMRMQVNTWEDGSGFAKGPCITLPVANYFRVAMGLRNTVLAAFFGLKNPFFTCVSCVHRDKWDPGSCCPECSIRPSARWAPLGSAVPCPRHTAVRTVCLGTESKTGGRTLRPPQTLRRISRT